MYQFIGDINDTKAGGLESLLNNMGDNFFTKGDPAVNEHHYHIIKNNITKKQITFTPQIKAKHLTLRKQIFNEQYFHK